jgi:hypothetical protein
MKQVISFTLFGSNDMYARGAVANAQLAATHYPGWTCRFHVGDSVDRATIAELAAMRNTQVVLHIGGDEDFSSLFWRFAGLDDESGSVWLFRDCDSRIGAREAAAVKEWLALGAQFHVMRDHPAHVLPVMAGMWGARGDGARKLAPLLPERPATDHSMVDQVWLRDVAYPVMRDSLVVHAEAGMGFGDEQIRPFPTSRRRTGSGFEFVGQGFTADGTPRLAQEGYRVSDEPKHEWRLFPEGTVPVFTTPEWYAGRDHAPHLEQVGHRDRLMFTAAQVAREAMTGLKTVVDLGAGDGGLLSLLGPAMRAWGYDLQPSNLDAAKVRGVDVRYGDVLTDDIEWGEIAVATEMLEHLIDPHAFVRRIGEHAKVLICSSPRLETADEHYEFHTWAWDSTGYRELVEQGGWQVKRHTPVHGFQVLVAVRP